MKAIAFSLIACMTLSMSLPLGAGQLEVLKNRVNLRAGNNSNKEVVGQVNAGDVLEYFSKEDDWFEVRPPESVSVYVHNEFVKEGVVQATPLNLRAGASLNYSRVGQVEQGYVIDKRSEKGDWIEIAPPQSTRVWIHSSMVREQKQITVVEEARPDVVDVDPDQPDIAESAATEVTESAVLKPDLPTDSPDDREGIVIIPDNSGSEKVTQQGGVVSTTTPIDAYIAAKDPVPSELEDHGLVPLEGQGESGMYEGTLRSSSSILIRRPARYRLVVYERDRPVTVCYVKGNRDQLKELKGRKLSISGDVYWLQGVKYPVIVPDKIQPL